MLSGNCDEVLDNCAAFSLLIQNSDTARLTPTLQIQFEIPAPPVTTVPESLHANKRYPLRLFSR